MKDYHLLLSKATFQLAFCHQQMHYTSDQLLRKKFSCDTILKIWPTGSCYREMGERAKQMFYFLSLIQQWTSLVMSFVHLVTAISQGINSKQHYYVEKKRSLLKFGSKMAFCYSSSLVFSFCNLPWLCKNDCFWKIRHITELLEKKLLIVVLFYWKRLDRKIIFSTTIQSTSCRRKFSVQASQPSESYSELLTQSFSSVNAKL